MHYWDMQGNPISMLEWVRLFESPERVIARYTLPNLEISTVWMGTDMGQSAARATPLIFETMVFADEALIAATNAPNTARTPTLEEARRIHAVMIDIWTAVIANRDELLAEAARALVDVPDW